jgi:hypothetical protein
MRDRHQYDTVYSCIESYICEFTNNDIRSRRGDQKIIVSSSLGTLTLLNMPRSIDDFTYVLYTESSLLHANNLANRIAELVKNKWIVTMRTIIQGNDFEIIVDNRRLVTFIQINNVPKGASAVNVIRPANAQLDGKPCLIMNPMFYLIDLYRDLYSPEKFKEWPTALQHEKSLFEYLKRSFLKNPISNGGKRRHYFGKYEPPKYKGSKGIGELSVFIMRKYIVNNKNIVLIGDSAQRLIIKSDIISSTLTVLSGNSVETDIENISKLLVDKYGDKYPVSAVHGNVKVMGDFRLTRTAIKVGSEHDRSDLMYIYNSADYELIPFNRIGTTDFVQIGNPFVILRFHLIDTWIIRWLVASGKLDDRYAEQKINKIMKNVVDLRSYMATDTRQLMGTTDAGTIKYEIDSRCITDGQPHTIFQAHIDSYIGVIQNETAAYKLYIQKKTNAAKAKGFYNSIYHPQKYYLEFGKYRTIEHA